MNAFSTSALSRARAGDRYVTVKGISEREVRPDGALWPVRLLAVDDDLSRANQRLAASLEKLRAFLAQNGIAEAETSLQAVKVTDAFADQYRAAGQVARRYVVETTLLVRSGNPDRVLVVSQEVGDLVRQGVVLSTREITRAPDRPSSSPSSTTSTRHDRRGHGPRPRGGNPVRQGLPRARSAASVERPRDSSRSCPGTRPPASEGKARSTSASAIPAQGLTPSRRAPLRKAPDSSPQGPTARALRNGAKYYAKCQAQTGESQGRPSRISGCFGLSLSGTLHNISYRTLQYGPPGPSSNDPETPLFRLTP